MLKKLLVLFTALYATLAMAAVDANKASADELTSVRHWSGDRLSHRRSTPARTVQELG